MKLSYYPGCSLEATAREYDASARAVCAALDVELADLADWNCCGATSAHNLNRLLALALPARNLVLAENTGLDLVTPCAACYSRLRTAEHTLRRGGSAARELEEAVGAPFGGRVTVLSLLEAMVRRVGLAAVEERVKRPLAGLKVACYYGCLLVRPREVTGVERPEDPVWLDDLMRRLGAEVVPWSFKTDCCGASQAITNPDVSRGLVARLLARAGEAGADALVTACPLCQTNMEMQRPASQGAPCFYFTELMGLAFGLDGVRSWLGRHLVDPFGLLRSLSLID